MIIFDFDGILLNSVYEVAITSFNAISGDLVTSLEELPDGLEKSFLKNRFHFQPAGDVLPLMSWCFALGRFEPERVLTAAEYASLLAAETRPLRERTEKFFGTRKLFVDRDKPTWLSLNKPYEPIWSSLRAFGSERVVILTNKNRQAVLDLTEHYDLILNPENVYSGDHAVTKTENLGRLHERFAAQEYLFVDDSIGNLRELRGEFVHNKVEFKLRLALGTWGYLGPTDIADAANEDFPQFGQSDVISLLEHELP